MPFRIDTAKIRRWREERQWSQEHLAGLAGISLRTLQRIEGGDPASGESLKALAAAFNVDVMALTVDPDVQAADAMRARHEKGRAALQLSFFIHLASWVLGMVVFAGISLGSGYPVMLSPAIWWTVGLVGHGVTVVIVELATRYREKIG